MSLQAKYQAVLDLGQELNTKEGYVTEENGVLKIGGVVHTQYEKNLLWDKIKDLGGDNPADIVADIRVETTDYYHKHTVTKGESLSKIAKHYYKDAMKYMHIFNANTNILSDPDLIEIGQELIIPFE